MWKDQRPSTHERGSSRLRGWLGWTELNRFGHEASAVGPNSEKYSKKKPNMRVEPSVPLCSTSNSDPTAIAVSIISLLRYLLNAAFKLTHQATLRIAIGRGTNIGSTSVSDATALAVAALALALPFLLIGS